MAANHRAAAMRGEVKAAILKVLDAAPNGKSGVQIALALDKSKSQTMTRLSELQAQGKVLGIVVQQAKGKPLKRWFALQFREQAMAAGLPGSARATTVAKAMAPKPTRRKDGDGPIVTEAPKFVDMRFTPERVEPFFSAMTPGSYIRTGSAIERAYAEREARARVSGAA